MAVLHIAAVFADVAGAHAAQSGLVAAGVDTRNILIIDRSHVEKASPAGVWAMLKHVFVPDEDATPTRRPSIAATRCWWPISPKRKRWPPSRPCNQPRRLMWTPTRRVGAPRDGTEPTPARMNGFRPSRWIARRPAAKGLLRAASSLAITVPWAA